MLLCADLKDTSDSIYGVSSGTNKVFQVGNMAGDTVPGQVFTVSSVKQESD